MKKILFISIIVILCFSIISAFYPMTILQVFITDKGSNFGKIVYETPSKIGDEFSVHWIHSVSLRPVIETYEIKKDLTISLKEMIFDSFSANLPAVPEPNTKWEFHKDYIRAYNYNMSFDAVPVVIGKVIANHSLIYNNKTIYLKEKYKPGGFVKIKVVHINLLNYLFKEVLINVRKIS